MVEIFQESIFCNLTQSSALKKVKEKEAKKKYIFYFEILAQKKFFLKYSLINQYSDNDRQKNCRTKNKCHAYRKLTFDRIANIVVPFVFRNKIIYMGKNIDRSPNSNDT